MAELIKARLKDGSTEMVDPEALTTKAMLAAGLIEVVHEQTPEPTTVRVWRKVLQEGVALTIACGTCKTTMNFDGKPELLEPLAGMLCIHVDKAEFAAAAEQYKAQYNGKGNSLGADYYKEYHRRKPDEPKVGLPDPGGNFINKQTERVSN